MSTGELPFFTLMGLTAAGVSVSILALLETRVPAIASFCAFFGQGCQKTSEFTLLRVPVAVWGLVFYLILFALITAAPALVFPAIMAGVGFEFTFLWIMRTLRAFCIFCLLNAVVVAGLFAVVFTPSLFWPAAAIALFFFMVSSYLVSRENIEAMAQEENAAEIAEKPAARIDGEIITMKELELPLKQAIHAHELKIYRLKRDRLEKMIIDRLADKKALPADVSDNAQRRKMLEDLKAGHDIEILIEKPTLPFIDVDVTGSPSLGPYNAPVVIIEFSDYLCPYCRDMHQLKDRITSAYGDRVQWVFKDFPLDMHKGAKEAAIAARCAGAQGKFREYQDLLFYELEAPDDAAFEAFAQKLGLDKDQFDRCRTSSAYKEKVEKDIQDGISAGVAETPTYIVNGRMLSGSLSRDEFTALIDEELRQAAE